jgi:hypothetical protein
MHQNFWYVCQDFQCKHQEPDQTYNLGDIQVAHIGHDPVAGLSASKP